MKYQLRQIFRDMKINSILFKFFRSFLLLLIAVASTAASYATIVMKPYLQAMSQNSVYVMVESTSESEVRVLYGENELTELFHNTNYILQTTAKPATYIHRIELDNLKPGTKYYYRVMQDGVDLPLESFYTISDNLKLKFAVIGDNRSFPDKFNSLLNDLKKHEPQLLLLTGDIAATPDYKTWKKDFFIPELLSIAKAVPFFNAVGNHERWDTNTIAFTQAPQSLSKKQEYYSFELSGILFVVLSTEHKIDPNTEQFLFLEKTLKQSQAEWKIVLFHKSAYVGGGHGEYLPMKKVADALFKKYNVDLAISGHSHFYQRNYVDNVYHLTIGGGGAPLYVPKKKQYTIKSVKKHHYAIIEIDHQELHFKAIDIDGKIIDEFKISKI